MRGWTAAAFDHQDRFITRCTARRGHEASGVTQVFKVEQNGAGFTVAGKEVEEVVDINIQAIPKRNKVREAHFALLRPVKNGIGNRCGLGDKRQLAAMNRYRRKAGIQPLPGRKQAQTVGAKQTHLIACGAFEQHGILFRRGGENNAGLAPLLPQRVQQLGVSPGVGTKHGQVRGEWQAVDGWPGQYAQNGLPGRGDGQDRAVESPGQQVTHHQITGALWFH